MKQLLILSGKGGTGKTTLASSLIKLWGARAYADCDVDAPNLHLIMEEGLREKEREYYGLNKAFINTELCTECDLCRQHCRFNAIDIDKSYVVNPYKCEGCSVCEMVCPVGAISMEAYVDGKLKLYTGDNKVFSTAQLKIGSGTSGLLVTEVKKQLDMVADKVDLAIIDGSPGIGCPVIASLSGADIVLIVAEPSLSGISDMERIIKTSASFNNKILVCVNKYDINMENTDKIEVYCKENHIDFIGKIPYDLEAIRAVNNGLSLVDIECKSGDAIRDIYKNLLKIIYGRN